MRHHQNFTVVSLSLRSLGLMRFARSLLLGVVGFGLAACADADLGPTTAKIPPLAFVRYINAMPDTLNTTVRWIDEVEFTPQTFTNVAYRAEGLGSFQGLKAGSRSLRVFTFQQSTNNFPVAGNTTILVDTTFTYEAGKYYTMIHAGSARAGTQRLLILEDEPPAQPSTGTLLRVQNFAYGLDWDLYLGRQGEWRDTTISAPDTTISGPDTTIVVTRRVDANNDTTVVTDTTIVPVDTVITRDTTITTRETTVGATFTAAQYGTLVASGTAGTVETAVRAYAAMPKGLYSARMTNPGLLTTRGIRLPAPNGLAETTTLPAAGGMNVDGSVITAWVFNAKTAGSPGATAAGMNRPFVLYTVDRSPARTIAP